MDTAEQHRHGAQARLTRDFTRFNMYADKALALDENAEVYAALAVAFEISQLRFQLRRFLAVNEVTA